MSGSGPGRPGPGSPSSPAWTGLGLVGCADVVAVAGISRSAARVVKMSRPVRRASDPPAQVLMQWQRYLWRSRTRRSAQYGPGAWHTSQPRPIRRSEIVRAKDNVPARHAKRPRGVCCGPPRPRSMPRRAELSWLHANCASQAVSCWTVENSVFTSGPPSSGFPCRAGPTGEFSSKKPDHYLGPSSARCRAVVGLQSATW